MCFKLGPNLQLTLELYLVRQTPNNPGDTNRTEETFQLPTTPGNNLEDEPTKVTEET